MTSDERREVAERLRYSAEQSWDAGVFDQEVLSILGVGTGDDDSFSDTNDVRRLADLIDRPTCEMKSIPKTSYRVCSRCGAFVRKDAVTDCTEVIPARFCPNCDARVVGPNGE